VFHPLASREKEWDSRFWGDLPACTSGLCLIIPQLCHTSELLSMHHECFSSIYRGKAQAVETAFIY